MISVFVYLTFHVCGGGGATNRWEDVMLHGFPRLIDLYVLVAIQCHQLMNQA